MSLKNNNLINVVENGGYPIIDFDEYAATILATGSEVEIACETSNKLQKEGVKVRVVSFPSWEIFDSKTLDEKEKILGNKMLFAIEAAVVNGWEKYIPKDNFIGMKSFGASAPYKKLYEHFGITSEKLAQLIKERLK